VRYLLDSPGNDEPSQESFPLLHVALQMEQKKVKCMHLEMGDIFFILIFKKLAPGLFSTTANDAIIFYLLVRY
jgi:hypothetical protein